MSTKLSYIMLAGRCYNVVGFCREKPKTVLRKVFPEYFIGEYKDLYLGGLFSEANQTEFHSRNTCYIHGLAIQDAEEAGLARGLKVVGKLDELLHILEGKDEDVADLLDTRAISSGSGRILPNRFQRTDEDVKEALKALIEHELGDYLSGKYKQYLQCVQSSIEERLPQVLDVVEIALNLPNPTVEDLRDILRGEYSKLPNLLNKKTHY